jgi:hypothetical protein
VHRPAPFARQPPQDPGEDRGFGGTEVSTEGDLHTELAHLPTRAGARGFEHPPQGAAEEILELAYFSGYTHVEIAELLGVPLGTVKGRMRLGLKKMRVYFAT